MKSGFKKYVVYLPISWQRLATNKASLSISLNTASKEVADSKENSKAICISKTTARRQQETVKDLRQIVIKWEVLEAQVGKMSSGESMQPIVVRRIAISQFDGMQETRQSFPVNPETTGQVQVVEHADCRKQSVLLRQVARNARERGEFRRKFFNLSRLQLS